MRQQHADREFISAFIYLLFIYSIISGGKESDTGTETTENVLSVSFYNRQPTTDLKLLYFQYGIQLVFCALLSDGSILTASTTFNMSSVCKTSSI